MRHRYIVPPPRRGLDDYEWDSDHHAAQFKQGDQVVNSTASDGRWKRGKVVECGQCLRVREPGKHRLTDMDAGQCDKVFRMEGKGRPKIINCHYGKGRMALSLSWLAYINRKRPGVTIWSGVGIEQDILLFNWTFSGKTGKQRERAISVSYESLLKCRSPEEVLAAIETEIAIQNVLETA